MAGCAGGIRDSDLDGGVFFVTLLAAETQTVFGNVVAFDDVFLQRIHADAGGDACAMAAENERVSLTEMAVPRPELVIGKGRRML